MDQVNEQQLKDAIVARDYKSWLWHTCSICRTPVGYVFTPPDGDPATPSVGYDNRCRCGGGYIQERHISNLMECFNRQTPEVRARLWASFDVRAETPTP